MVKMFLSLAFLHLHEANKTISTFTPPINEEIHAVFTCQWSFDHLAPWNIKNFQPIKEPCDFGSSLRTQFIQAGPNAIGIPTQEWENYIWVDLTKEFTVAISPRNTTDSLSNKLKFKLFMQSIDLGELVPRQYKTSTEAVYPCIVKLNPFTGTDSKGVHVVQNSTHLLDLVSLHGTPNEPYLLEEAIMSSDEICFSLVAFKGKLLKTDDCLHFNPKGKRLAILDGKTRYSRSRVVCRNLPDWSRVQAVSEAIVARSALNGIACIQYKYNATGAIKILELNPRLCAGLTRNAPALAEFIWLWWGEHKREKAFLTGAGAA